MIERDLIVIGSGPGGYPAAAAAAAQGRKVTVIERGLPGGTCLNRGCIPTKCLARTAEVALTAREAAGFGILTGETRVDYGRAVDRKNEVIAGLREGVKSMLAGVETVEGEARIVSGEPLQVAVGNDVYTAPQVIIATGSEPVRLNIPGAELAMTSDEILELRELPASLAVIGGGVIGLEFASIFAALGVEVTVIEYCKEVLPPFDSEIAKRLRMALKKRGVSFILGAEVTAMRPGIEIDYTAKDKTGYVVAEAVLMAVGRKAVIPAGTTEAGVEITRRGISVNPQTMESSVKGLYAVGDVNGLCQLAHAATAQGLRAVGEDVDLEPVPSAVFTVPEAAMSGLTEAQAEAAGYKVKIGKATFRSNGKALAEGDAEGMVKVVIDADTDRILGAHILGLHAADLIHELSLAIAAGVTAGQLHKAVHAHPTLAETVAHACKA
ncbi:MAG: dihydrolipoyl dehydrogenase [Bacteroides sp.]|nr:dihydrolipoyl dehydrogenase [Bacteroides sp.]